MSRWLFRRSVLLAVLAAALLSADLYAGYAAHDLRVLPIGPFVKRTLSDLGVTRPAPEAQKTAVEPENGTTYNTLEIKSAFYDFTGKIYDIPSPYSYGGLETIGDALVFVGGKGRIWQFSEGRFVAVYTDRIPLVRGVDPAEEASGRFESAVVKDVKLVGNFLYASAIEYFAKDECVTMSLFRIEVSLNQGVVSTSGNWKKVFGTVPCLTHDEETGEGPSTMEGGGRIDRLSGSSLLLTVGHFGFNGIDGKAVSQDPAGHYGKILEIDTATFEARIFSSGHRNPQGLVVTKQGAIFETEHGPRGGDELNRIVRGRNYGWPLVTYGTDYGSYVWRLDQTPKDHSGYEKPVHAWVPSIATSQLIEVDNEALPHWHGDLLVSTLFKVSLFRVRLDSGRPILIEPIYIGSRIRDIVGYGKGFALLIDQENKLIIMRPAKGPSPRPGA